MKQEIQTILKHKNTFNHEFLSMFIKKHHLQKMLKSRF